MRRVRLRTRRVIVHAPRKVVFEVVAADGRVVERRSETELVVERTIALRRRARAALRRRAAETLQLVTLHAPERIEYRSLEGPVHRIEQSVTLSEPAPGATRMTYRGHFWTRGGPLGWVLGRARAKRSIDRAVTAHLQHHKGIAERQAARARDDRA
jgi:hypothetical protein